MKLTNALVAVLLTAGPAAAQTPPITLTPASPRVWDIAGDVGWLTSRQADLAQPWNDWYDVASVSGSVARYLTPHVRTELRVGTAGEGRTYEEERVPLPGQPFPLFRLREHYFQTSTVGAGVYYQFLENQWFHPFAGAGLDVERLAHRTRLQDQRFPFAGPLTTAPTISFASRPFVATGFKWYVNERGFIRSDVKLSSGPNGNVQVAWSAGIGVDL